MTESAKKFLEEVSADPALAQQLREINEKYPTPEENVPALIALAAEHGVHLTADDVKADAAPVPMSDDELSAVTGGAFKSNGEQGCYCVLGGHGEADQYMKACYCAMGGAGELTQAGKDNDNLTKAGGVLAMFCVTFGY